MGSRHVAERLASAGETPAVGDGAGARRWPSWFPLAASAAVLLYGAGFHRTFQTLWNTWRTNDNYSHGVLIAPISALLVFRMRRELLGLPVAPGKLGLLLLFAGAALEVIGIRGDVTIFQGWASILVLAGIVWAWFGTAWIRKLAFPIAFLFFMVPSLPVFVNEVSFRLKVVAATGAVHLAQGLGVAVTQRGMDLFFPSGALTVENACSGLNSLVALMAMGALVAYLGEGALWRRGVLFALTLPIAVIGNLVRLTSLCVMAVFTTADKAGGVFHDVGGFVVYGIALVLLLSAKRLLRC